MLGSWLSPLLGWLGVSLVELLLVIILIIVILKD